MTDRPIIFSAPMVRALLDGRKTQTRRILKLPKWASADPSDIEFGTSGEPEVICRDTGCLAALPMPYAVGDRLYVREAWAPVGALTHNDPGSTALIEGGFFRANDSTVEGEIARWRPSIHMPRWASRLTLVVTDVRVGRLHDIDEADALAEGIQYLPDGSPIVGNPYGLRLGEGEGFCSGETAAEAFRALWQVIHGVEAWATNPWVAAISFTVHHANIDEVLSEAEA